MKTNLFLSVLLMSFLATAHAKQDLAKGAEFSVQSPNQNFAAFVIADTIDQPTTCDYTFKSFQYLPALKSIVIEASRELCGLEFEGKGLGVMTWQMPLEMRGYSETKVVLNGQMMGTLVHEPSTKKLELKNLAQ